MSSRWNDEWERLDMVGEEIVGAGDKVFVAMHYRGRGRLSGVDFETRAEALEAVGLSE